LKIIIWNLWHLILKFLIYKLLYMTIDITIFIISVIIGIGIIYISNEPTQILIKYPNGTDKTIYVDKENVCYRYVKKEL